MSAFFAGLVFGACGSGWLYALVARKPRLMPGPGLDVGGAVRRPETREEIRRALKGGGT